MNPPAQYLRRVVMYQCPHCSRQTAVKEALQLPNGSWRCTNCALECKACGVAMMVPGGYNRDGYPLCRQCHGLGLQPAPEPKKVRVVPKVVILKDSFAALEHARTLDADPGRAGEPLVDAGGRVDGIRYQELARRHWKATHELLPGCILAKEGGVT